MDDVRQRGPLVLIGTGLGIAGATKLASTTFTVEHFDHWGYPQLSRHVIGAIEVGVGASALAGLVDRQARLVAGVGTLCSMAGALATHIRSGDSVPNFIPPVILAACGIAALTSASASDA